MPTREQMDDVERRIGELIEERFLPDNDWMRPAAGGTPGSVPWSELSREQQAGVLVSEVWWAGFEAGQIADVSTRVIDGEPPDDWMGDIVASDWREQGQAAHAEHLEERRARDRGFGSRDEQPDRDETSIRPLTRELIDCCRLDVWPGMATTVDFGLDSSSHLGALQFAIREELVTPQELDAAMGNGPALTEIARRGENPYRDVSFNTSWDKLRAEPEDFGQPGGAERAGDTKVRQASYDDRLQEAAEHGMSIPRDQDRGRDR